MLIGSLIFNFLWQEKGIKVFETTQPDGKTKQVFFFDPDGERMLAVNCLV